MCFYSLLFLFFFFKQKTAYEMRISDWSSDVCSSDLLYRAAGRDRHARGTVRGLDLGAAWDPCEAVRPAQRPWLLRRAAHLPRSCRRTGLSEAYSPRDADRRG